MDQGENTPIKKTKHEIGMSLDELSIDELGLRIGLMEDEITRLLQEIEVKKSSHSAADALFNL